MFVNLCIYTNWLVESDGGGGLIRSDLMAEDKYNLKNPAVKRILQEVKEMQSNPSDDFMSLPLEV